MIYQYHAHIHTHGKIATHLSCQRMSGWRVIVPHSVQFAITCGEPILVLFLGDDGFILDGRTSGFANRSGSARKGYKTWPLSLFCIPCYRGSRFGCSVSLHASVCLLSTNKHTCVFRGRGWFRCSCSVDCRQLSSCWCSCSWSSIIFIVLFLFGRRSWPLLCDNRGESTTHKEAPAPFDLFGPMSPDIHAYEAEEQERR